MSIKEQVEQDLKQAMLAGEKTLVTTLRGVKSAILNEEIANNARDTGLPDEKVQQILGKEAKKRQESADLYTQGGNQEKADAELVEKEVIQKYLPAQLSEDELRKLVDEAIAQTGATGPQQMGQVIGAVKQQAGASADGGLIAKLAKEKLT